MPRKRPSKKARKAKPEAKRARRPAPKAPRRPAAGERTAPGKMPPEAAKAPERREITKASLTAPRPSGPKRIDVTPKLRRAWLSARRAYNMSYETFHNSLSSLSEEEAEALYAFSVAALYKGNVAEVLAGHPELRGLVGTDEDRLCMLECYEALSLRLRKTEPMPKDRAVIERFRQATKGSILP